MKATYFPDTDTMLLAFSEKTVAETFDLNENVVVDVDETGGVVALTIEHAQDQMDVREFIYHRAS